MSHPVQIRFTATGSSAATGNFAPGDLLRCSAEHAHHLVHEAACAQYVDGQPSAPADTKPPPRTAKAPRTATKTPAPQADQDAQP